jgi:hypothetical protein
VVEGESHMPGEIVLFKSADIIVLLSCFGEMGNGFCSKDIEYESDIEAFYTSILGVRRIHVLAIMVASVFGGNDGVFDSCWQREHAASDAVAELGAVAEPTSSFFSALRTSSKQFPRQSAVSSPAHFILQLVSSIAESSPT